MSRAAQKKAINANDRKIAGDQSLTDVSLLFPESTKSIYKWDDLLDKTAFQRKPMYLRSGEVLSDGSILFNWVGMPTTITGRPNDPQSVHNALTARPRELIAQSHTKKARAQSLAELKKLKPLSKGKARDPDYGGPVGGHVASQAFLGGLKKAVKMGVFTDREAQLMARTLSHGGASVINAIIGGGLKEETYKDGMIKTWTNRWGVSDELLQEVSAQGMDYDLTREFMVAIPGTMNTEQEKLYEDSALTLLKAYCEKWIEGPDNVGSTPGSLTLTQKIAEVIANRLLGKPDRRYKDDYDFKTQTSKTTTKTQKVKGPKDSSKAKNAYRKHLINQFKLLQNPVGLKALISKKLPQTVMNNMGAPALENRTGRFASGVHIANVLPDRRGGISLQYSYQLSPYQVFEGGPKSNSGERDPRTLIEQSIREIAAGLSLRKFYMQRV